MRNLITYSAATVLVLSCWSATTGAQSPQASRVLIDSLAGRDSFELYCAACHGSDGRGGGPVAAELRTQPSDLTVLARRNNGAFPRDAVREFIVGTARPLAAHGTTEMPVWGPMFRVFESDARVRERIANLVTYIERLQQPSTGPDDLGSQLFRSHCASCHGTDARGNGPLAEHLRNVPPDLTQFTEAQWRNVPTRADTTHHRRTRCTRPRGPGYAGLGRGLQGGGGSNAAAVKARIEAVVRYLEGIQERSL